jgi:ammonia channel protein AmtB
VEVAFINILIGGSFGGLSALFVKWILSKTAWKKIETGESAPAVNPYLLGSSMTLDNFSLGRGIVAGCIAVAGGGIHYKVWISPVVGAAGGIAYACFCAILHKFKVDDPTEIFQTHGVPAVVALIATIFFDQKEGLFF